MISLVFTRYTCVTEEYFQLFLFCKPIEMISYFSKTVRQQAWQGHHCCHQLEQSE